MNAHSSSRTDSDPIAVALLSYLEACESGAEPDRASFLNAHPGLRAELEEFFEGQDQLTSLTAAHLETQLSGAADSGAVLGQLGDFRLIREVGRGGMGLVYEAEQISLRRRVALKVLPFAAAVDPRRLQRFQNEAAAAAHLRHENIVPVYGVGCERGVHYYSMQFVDGQSLAALISELRSAEASAADGSPSTEPAARLSTERREGRPSYFDWVARIALQAARALDHAHETGIVHRDVKPGNLLLDLHGQLWVTDFGLAMVAGDSGLTVTGELLGTLRYASPEQALGHRGVVDHRSDVYSLGATLYELLTLRPLFNGSSRHSLLRQIAEEMPVPPRMVTPGVPVALETIVLKALRKDQADRYLSARDFADDLQRFLDRQPVLARPPGPGERFRMWSRRHPAIIVAAGMLSIVATTGAIITAALVGAEQERTRAAHLRTERAYVRERQRAEEAEARLALARRAVDELFHVSEEELADRVGLQMLRKRLLRTALAYYQELLPERRNDPAAQAELMETTARVEQILADLAMLRSASHFHLLTQAPVIADLKLTPDQETRLHELTERVSRKWGELFRDSRELPAGERTRRSVVQARLNDAELGRILTPDQSARLQQIGLQSEGFTAFRDPEVAAALQLTSAQRSWIRQVEDETAWEWMRGRGSERGQRPNAAAISDELAGVLTPKQIRTWQNLIGEPLHDVHPPFAGPPRSSAPRTEAPAESAMP